MEDPKSFCISTEQRCDGVIDCVGGEDEYCPNSCSTNGTVRLVGGRSPHEGRVELCSGGEWTRVCDRSISNRDAQVICRQLGYPTESKTVSFHCTYMLLLTPFADAEAQCCLYRLGFGYDIQPTAKEIFHCSGDEQSISQCDTTPADISCGLNEHEIVSCSKF